MSLYESGKGTELVPLSNEVEVEIEIKAILEIIVHLSSRRVYHQNYAV